MVAEQIQSVQQAFEQFERDVVRVPNDENDAAKEVHPQIRDTLAAGLSEHRETFLSGSYSRRMQVVKLKDVDIIVVLDDPEREFEASAEAALEAIRKAALASDLARSATKRVRSVRLTLHDHEFTVDLVAALEPPAGDEGLLLARRIPEEDLDDWTLGHPRGQRQAAIDKNEQCGGIYIPSVRLVKYWLGTVWGDAHKPFRSYHAESVLHGALSRKVEYQDVMVAFFDAAYAALAPGVLTRDPGAPDTYVDERLDDDERRVARDAVARAREAAWQAYETKDAADALDAWVEVFGSAFPAPSTSPEKVAAALGARTAGVVGAGLRIGKGRPVIESRPWREDLDAVAIGRRLQRARLAAGLSQAQVADSLEIPRSAVSLMEAGRRSVSSVELGRLVRLYGKPASAFLFEPEEEQVLQYFRAEAPIAEPDEAVVGEAIEWCRYYAMLEDSIYGEQRYDLPTYRVPRGLAIDQGASLAEQERRRLGLGDGPVPSMIDLLEHEGVKVLRRQFPSDSSVSGFFFFSPDIGPCAIINTGESPSRQRFTAAHEYAHFLVDRDERRGEICDTARRREPFEMRANAFAAAFLLPVGGMESALDDLGAERHRVQPEHAVHLMYHFGVSYDAVLWRLLNLGWITRDRRDELAGVSPTGLARALGYDYEPGESEPEPERWRTIAIEAWREGEISLGKLSELLDVPKAQLRAVLTRPEQPQARPARAPAAEPDWL
jgi:Zn-dependent peptidase ImmA (M78 family)/transcriptional regulator with XRE-family HTH domain